MESVNFHYLLFASFFLLIQGIDTNILHFSTGIPKEEIQEPRVSRRVVKLYSGSRPKPIVCNSEGFQADPEDCSVFHRCVKSGNGRYLSFKFQCGPGTIYDPDAEICNHPETTKRSECGGKFVKTSQSTYDNEINKEVPTPISTKEPIYLNTKTDNDLTTPSASTKPKYPWTFTNNKKSQSIVSLSKPYLTSEKNSNSKESMASTTKNPTSTLSQKLTPSSPRTIAFNNRLQSSQPGEICISDGFMGDRENCRKFYRCVGNKRGGFLRYEFLCNDPTIWDDDKQACNHAWLVQKSRCGRESSINIKKHETLNESVVHKNTAPTRQIKERDQLILNQNNDPDRSPPGSQIQLQVNYGSKASQQQIQISKGNIHQNQTQINYNKNGNVKQNQTQITYGSATSQSQSQISFGDRGVQMQLQIDHSNESSQLQSQIIESTASSNTRPSTKVPGFNEICTMSGFIGDTEDCKKFYRCVDNGKGSFTRYEFSCGEGTVWDSNLESCNHAWAVKRCGGKGSSESSFTSSTTTTSTTTSTQNYYITEETTEESNDIQYGNQQTSVSTSKPIPPVTTVVSKPESVDENKCKYSGFMGDNSDCKKFYRCVDSGNGQYTRFEFSCGEGTVWDSKIEACNHAWAVEKCGGNDIEQIDKQETTTIKEIHTTQTSSQLTSQMDPQNEDYDTGYVHQLDQSSSSMIVTKTTQAFPPTTTTTSLSSTSFNQNIDNTCQSSGFMGDSHDCKKFYRCVDNGNGGFTRYEFTCGEGTVWDSKIDACNHAWAVKKCGSNDSTMESQYDSSIITPVSNDEGNQSGYPAQNNEYISEKPIQNMNSSAPINTTTESNVKTENNCKSSGFMGDIKDCKKFYRCVDDGKNGYIQYEFTCGEGTVWDQTIESCNHVSAVSNCTQSDINHTTSSFESTTQSITKTTTMGTTLPSSASNNNLQESNQTDASCKNEGFYGDPDDCRNFYRCVDNGEGSYTKYEFTCGEGTYWDQEILTCNHISSDSKCKSNVMGATLTTSEPDLEHIQTSPIPQQEQNPQVTESSETNSYDDNCKEEGFFANSNNCKKFYRCVRNEKGSFTKYEFSCGDGTIWVQEIQACDHDNGIMNCGKNNNSMVSQITDQGQYSSSTQSTNQTQSQTQENDEYSEGNSHKPSSSNTCISEGFYANENDCRQFYRCVDDGKGGFIKYDFTCAEGTAWDSNIQTCNHISEVQSCENFNQHDNQMEPAMHDDEISQTTESTSTTKESASSQSSNQNNDRCEHEGFFGNTQDCTKFYRCVDDGKGGLTKYDFDCGEGTIWDQDITTCNHPQDVTHPSCKTNEEGSGSSSTESSSTTSSSSISSSTTDENSSEKPDQQIKCEKAGFYAYPNDCKKFYRCVDWDGKGEKFSVYHFECGEGTIWDPQLDTCNHEESVYPPRNCSGSQNENVSQETTTTEKSTTQENTSTSQSTTTDKTTTQQSTTTLQTTQQSTTSEETDTQSTTIEQTTQQLTTSEQTTQQSTTIEQTTQQVTTSEQTTQQSSTSEQTTQQSSTNDQTTSQQSTTEQTKETTTAESTEVTTTEQSTTQKTPSEQTTDSETTLTTDQSTTEEQVSDETTTSKSSTTTTEKDDTTTTENAENTTTEETSSQKQECPETEDGQFLYVCPTSFKRHPKYCNMFYQCTEDEDSHEIKIATFTCPNNTIYDESQTQCVDEDKADKKCDGQRARKHRVKRLNYYSREPIEADQNQHKCKNVGYYPFEKSNECSRVFLKCQQTRTGKLRGYVYQCPEGFVYWNISKRCEKINQMKYCQTSSNRNWENRYEIPVEKKNLAK